MKHLIGFPLRYCIGLATILIVCIGTTGCENRDPREIYEGNWKFHVVEKNYWQGTVSSSSVTDYDGHVYLGSEGEILLHLRPQWMPAYLLEEDGTLSKSPPGRDIMEGGFISKKKLEYSITRMEVQGGGIEYTLEVEGGR